MRIISREQAIEIGVLFKETLEELGIYEVECEYQTGDKAENMNSSIDTNRCISCNCKISLINKQGMQRYFFVKIINFVSKFNVNNQSIQVEINGTWKRGYPDVIDCWKNHFKDSRESLIFISTKRVENLDKSYSTKNYTVGIFLTCTQDLKNFLETLVNRQY